MSLPLEWEKNGVIKEKAVTFFSGASTGQVLNKQILDHDKEFSFFFFLGFPSLKPKDYEEP